MGASSCYFSPGAKGRCAAIVCQRLFAAADHRGAIPDRNCRAVLAHTGSIGGKRTLCWAVFLISIAFYLLLMAAFRESTLDPAASPETVERFRRDYKLGPPLYLLAAAAAPFSAWLSLGICTALWIFWAVSTREC